MESINLFFTNFQSIGDVLYSIPIVENIINNNSNVNIEYCTFISHGYLLQHLPIKLKLIDSDYRIKSGQDFWYKNAQIFCPNGYHHFFIDFGGTDFKSKSEYLISEFKKKNIFLEYPLNENIYIELPDIPIEVKPKSIYVETGQSISRLNVNIFDVEKFSLFFPSLNFYTTSNINIKRKNIIDCSNKNIIELSNISKKCCAIIGHGSGPFVCTHNSANKNKYKFVYKESQRDWDLDNPNYINVYDDKPILEFFRTIR